MKKPKPEFTIEELLSQLRPGEEEEGYTTKELCEMAGLPPTTGNMGRVRRRVTNLRALGEWEVAPKKKVWNEMHQCYTHIPAARPVKEKSDERGKESE